MVKKVDLLAEADAVPALFAYREIGSLNDHMLNVLQAENRTLDFHVHESSDELFYCIQGEFDVEFDDGLLHLREGELVIVPRGTRHRPVCKELVKCLLVEMRGTLTRENTGGTYGDDKD